MNINAFFNWSSGKDSSLALYKTLKSGDYEVKALFTCINAENKRISMHGVHKSLLIQQAKSIGIPLEILELPENIIMEEYDIIITNAVNKFKEVNITTSIFGDIFLEDLKQYRIKQLKKLDMDCYFPLWKIDTKLIIKEFIDLGFKAIVTCVNTQYLDESFVGRVIDDDFINDLPKNVDICGENGEFHSFVFDGPIFKSPIKFELGEKVYKEYKTDDDSLTYGFWFCDLISI